MINPAKTFIGKPAKTNLDKIDNFLKQKSNLRQWKNIYEVLNLFNNLSNKSISRFIKLDIVSFYPNISATILESSFNFAAGLTEITEDKKELIRHCCKSVLFHKGEPWSKKHNKNCFDVPMGSFHGAKIFELVGLYILDILKKEKIFNDGNFGLNRDDGLAVVDILPGSDMERKVKQLKRFLTILALMLPFKPICLLKTY